MTGYIIDGVAILLLLIGAISGLRKGIIESVLSLITTGAALFVSVFFAKDITLFVCKYVNIQYWIENYINSINEGSSFTFFGMDITNVEASSILAVVLVGLMTFILIKLVIAILIKICNSISNYSPTFSGLNKLLGFFFGAVKNAVIIAIILAICSFCIELPYVGAIINDAIQQSFLTKYAYTYVVQFVSVYCTPEAIQGFLSQLSAITGA